jgi:hypothetical protein
MKKEVYKLTMTIKVPEAINFIPTRFTIEYLLNSLPYILSNIFQGQAEIEVKEDLGRS